MTKNRFCIASSILLVAGIGAFAVFHSKQKDNHSVINNLRAIDIDEAAIRLNEKRDAFVLSNVPPGTAFSKAVAVLGSHYNTMWTNSANSNSVIVRFPCSIPGVTNRLYVNFIVTSNVVEGTTGDWQNMPMPW